MIDMWGRRTGGFDLERELRRNRPEASPDFVTALTSQIRGHSRPRSSFRLALVGALTVGIMVALAGFGGLGAATAAPGKVVAALVNAISSDGVQLIQQSPACAQYGIKANAGRGNLSETASGTRSMDSATLINPHVPHNGLGPGDFPTADCDPGNSGAHNRGGD